MNRLLLHPLFKPAAGLLALGPFLWLAYAAVTEPGLHLGANPAETLIRETGEMTLRLLCATLAITPLRHWTGWHALARLRRMLGLCAFFYGVVHFLCFAWLDMGLDWGAILVDIVKRPFILVGTAALLGMLPLAATSFNRAIKSLGPRRWQLLHRTVYAVAGLALLHFFWMRAGKNDFADVAVYAAILAGLLGWRAWRKLQALRPGTSASRPKAPSTDRFQGK
jgi:sulfoxide reductase heme-binding subunit YedZ